MIKNLSSLLLAIFSGFYLSKYKNYIILKPLADRIRINCDMNDVHLGINRKIPTIVVNTLVMLEYVF